MKRSYIEEIIHLENSPYGYGGEQDSRNKFWNKQREINGFDERETWNLDITFFCWLYERLKMYKEIACINLKFHEFEVNGKTLSQLECIDLMIEKCADIIKNEQSDEILYRLEQEVLDIWCKCYKQMWW